jgi:hypothetical protein
MLLRLLSSVGPAAYKLALEDTSGRKIKTTNYIEYQTWITQNWNRTCVIHRKIQNRCLTPFNFLLLAPKTSIFQALLHNLDGQLPRQTFSAFIYRHSPNQIRVMQIIPVVVRLADARSC